MRSSNGDSKPGPLAWLPVLIALAATIRFAPATAQTTPQIACPSCEDYNACTVDSCDEATGTCRHDPLDCDDGNSCTNDICLPYGFPSTVGCRHPSVVAGSACHDGNPCTGADACDGAGHCVGSPLAAGTACDDDNGCTNAETCDESGACSGTALQQGAECDDHNACTRGERCAAAPDGTVACLGGTLAACDDGLLCTTDSCDPITGDCVHTALVCDDGNPCTNDVCDPAAGACVRTTREGSCDDRNICTTGEFCSDGNCLGGAPAKCGWGSQCGSSTCLPLEQRCLTSNSPSGCPPAPQCQRNECVNGICNTISDLSGTCTDGNPCTRESCVRGGCQLQLLVTGDACNDGSACTLNDVCQSGQCRGTSVCSDGDACTTDLCDPTTAACLGSQAVNCDDFNPCTTDSCDPATGCRHVLNTDPCDDHNACTSGDTCANGACRGTPTVTCPDDGNPCTDNRCNESSGTCIQMPNTGTLCNDGNPCTVSDTCSNGVCVPGPPKVCNDFNVCTANDCVASTGACVFSPVDGPCSDGNACTVGDTCVSGACEPGVPANCDDGNSCTTDGCNPSPGGGCFHTVRTGLCDDGNPCTTGDACVGGTCRPTDPVSCIDGNACTIDHCDRTTGACVHETISIDCDDGDVCTVDLCDPATGTCLGREPVNCDDGIDCTLDACDPASGCTHELVCPQEVVDIALSNSSPLGHGSGTLTWRTTFELSVLGFNILAVSPQGDTTRLNLALIPCTECVTAGSASYLYILPKHKSGKNIFVQLIGRDGGVLGVFGPAVKGP